MLRLSSLLCLLAIGCPYSVQDGLEPGPADSGRSPTEAVPVTRLESYDLPNHYVRHYDFVARLDPDVSPLEDSEFAIVPGLADASGVSFESQNYPGYYLRHYDYKLRLDPKEDSTQFAQDATFVREAGLADITASSFRSFNYPMRHLRHSSDLLLRVDPISSDSDRPSATFKEQVSWRKAKSSTSP
jgi:hypothetical protein